MDGKQANITVFLTSAIVLVLEIVAGRLMAPYIGVSLETFTAIIGTVLAGIAAGATVGGWAADLMTPRRLLGPVLVLGGILSWISLPIVTALGPRLGSDIASIVILTAAAFFLPAAVLSTVSPMVAKLRLASLEETGAVVGGLSAAGTIGALFGTFVTGFVLVALLPSRTIVLGVGLVSIVFGLLLWWRLRDERPPAGVLGLIVVVGVLSPLMEPPCDRETSYYCVRVVADDVSASGRSLYLDRTRHAYIDLDDPTNLDIRYIRVFAQVADQLDPGPLRVLHIGGGGFTFPRYVAHMRPGSVNEVLEIDAELVEVAEAELGLDDTSGLDITIGDGRLALDALPDDAYDLVVGDVFGSKSVPWHLTTSEVMQEVERIVAPDGLYMMNVIDGGPSDFARAELATLRERFDYVAVVLPNEEVPAWQSVNQILLASNAQVPDFVFAADDGRLFSGPDIDQYIGDAQVLTDDFAPVDQLQS